MFTSDRFIMVLRSGVMNPAKQHASRTSFLSACVYAISIGLPSSQRTFRSIGQQA